MIWVLVLILSASLEALWGISVVAVEKRSIGGVVAMSMIMPLIVYINNIIVIDNHSYILPSIIGHGLGGLAGMLMIIYVWSEKSGPKGQ